MTQLIFVILLGCFSMDAFAKPEMGFTYSKTLASQLGMPADKATKLDSPLLGIGLEVKQGITGYVTNLHLILDSNAPIRLPKAQSMFGIGANSDMAPFGFISRLNDKEMKKFFGHSTGQLSNLTATRHSKIPFTKTVKMTEDKEASYSSMPIIAYMKNYLPGLTWVAVSANSELLSGKSYTHHSVLFEKAKSKEGQILSLNIDPKQMIELAIPNKLIDGMKSALSKPGDKESMSVKRDKFFEVF